MGIFVSRNHRRDPSTADSERKQYSSGVVSLRNVAFLGERAVASARRSDDQTLKDLEEDQRRDSALRSGEKCDRSQTQDT